MPFLHYFIASLPFFPHDRHEHRRVPLNIDDNAETSALPHVTDGDGSEDYEDYDDVDGKDDDGEDDNNREDYGEDNSEDFKGDDSAARFAIGFPSI